MKDQIENPALKKMQDAKAKLDAARQVEALKMADCFETVFGQEGKRGAAQKVVMEHLRLCAGMGNAFDFNAPHDGVKTMLAGVHRDGAASQIRLIEYYLRIAKKK
jgi:hypothetical protein